ncbi:MAG: hypothetical protein HC921_08425 [Synechococcaceae cyanobacterium SM2_3_1]|nr:hypothetical protein [Synechococcaceae cyanobacterium SM2_3_1]
MAARTQVMEAVETLGYRVTLGDVAASTGLALPEARRELLTLAQEGEGHLQVSGRGDISYSFSPEFRQILNRKQRQSRWAQIRRKIWNACLYLFRISFGILLVVSIVLIALALIALQMASRGEQSNNRRGGGMPIFFWPHLWVGNPFWAPYPSYPQTRQRRVEQHRSDSSEKEMSFLEAVYSFLFGDGNPNADLEEERYRLIGQQIRQSDGVISGEQVLPYLEVEPNSPQLEYEDYMFPILVKFDGQPQVNETGDIVYVFPELQVQASERKPRRVPTVLEEQRWPFSLAPQSKLVLAGGLGGLNFVLALILFSARDQVAVLAAESGILALISPLIGLLMAYGTLFLTVPLLRWFTLRWRNQRLAARNQRRHTWAEQLQDPSPHLQTKLAFAQELGQQQLVSEEETIYSTDRDLIEQRDYELDDPRFRSLLSNEPSS